MGRKRKRTNAEKGTEGALKRQRILGPGSATSSTKSLVVKQAVLSQYYPKVFSLREYLLSKLPPTSKVRRKKIISIGSRPDEKDTEKTLSSFLDRTLIGSSESSEPNQKERWQQWTALSQKPEDDSIASTNLSAGGIYSQSEVIDFAIWLLFSKPNVPQGKFPHLLCQGFRKNVTSRHIHREEIAAASNIPGVVSVHPNTHVTSMKAWPWPNILALMGKAGEGSMVSLVVDCGIFVAVDGGYGTYHQLSGYPLGESLSVLSEKPTTQKHKDPRSPASINFVRNRMMYARAALNAQGEVRFGLRHIHILNRYPYSNASKDANVEPHVIDGSTLRVMMYMFPRQFGLHNPFTSDVDSRQTVQPFNDYTLREEEINRRYRAGNTPKVPKRLRGLCVKLVQKLQIQHNRCSYKSLLEYYCPKNSCSSFRQCEETPESSAKINTQVPTSTGITTTQIISDRTPLSAQKPSMMEYSTPCSSVSAFCRAVLSHLVPRDFWGSGDTNTKNEMIFYQNVDHFIELRRFETLSLHEVSQGIRISQIKWLCPHGSATSPMSQTDTKKRWEIFHEFLYYVFDSLLIPLLRANFHITESNIHRYRIFYFRHDVWRSLAEPALASLKVSMFEEMKREKARKLLDSRSLGFSQVRLLPKETGIRPIMNLRRRAPKKGSANFLGPSINSILSPVYNVLTYEKALQPARLGATLFSVGDLYIKLKAFKSSLPSTNTFYFVKLDVQAAFDTIPQAAVLELVSKLPTEAEYRISKHVEIKPGEDFRFDANSRPRRKWTALARPLDDYQTFDEALESELAIGKKNTVFIENVVNGFRDSTEILTLLTEHIRQNIVKIGKKFYRQKEGIPQGSVLSSLLCNLFYADLEAQHLAFLQPEQSLLLRLIDDFLLITTNPQHAKQFLQVMHDGLPAYGVRVNPHKTLVNFEVTINDKKIERLIGNPGFPYCGNFIDMKTLNISKDRHRKQDMAIIDSLTVEYSRIPGKSFQRKVLNTFKLQAHAMFLDTAFNSLNTVRENVYSAFVETATKMCAYIRCLPKSKKPGFMLMINTFQSLTTVSYVLLKSKATNPRNVGYKCALNKAQVEGLAIVAFLEVLEKQQTRYREVLSWLKGRLRELKNKADFSHEGGKRSGAF